MSDGRGNGIAELLDVTKVFGTNAHRTFAVRNVNLRAKAGELLLLLGPSGSGKSTVLNLIAGLIEPTSGTVKAFGRDLRDYSQRDLQQMRALRLGFVSQNFLLIDAFTVAENVALAPRLAGQSRAEARGVANRILSQLHIDPLLKAFPPTLSQGERQRVAVARAIAHKPDLIIADEPTASLESGQGFEIIRLLHDYSRRDKCVIVATHDLRMVEFADRVLRIEDGALQTADVNNAGSKTN